VACIGVEWVVAHVVSLGLRFRTRLVARPGALTAASLAAIVAVSLAFGFYNFDFLYGAHFDEPVKVALVADKPHNYFHPPLLIVLARLVVWLGSASGDLERLWAGRFVSVMAMTAAGALFYLVLIRYADRLQSLIWSCVFASSPAIAVHAHFFKEDALLVFAICLGLHALVRLTERMDLRNLVYFGIALGLAPSAKYVGLLNSIALFAFAQWYCRPDMRGTALVVVSAFATMLAVLLVSFASESGTGLGNVLAGLATELKHAENGHDLKEWFWAGYGLTHLRHHLLPSITAMTFLIGLGAICHALVKDRDRQVAAFAAAALTWLFVLELSPLKIVGQMRYVLPVVIYFLLAAGIASSRSVAVRSRAGAMALALIALTVTAHAGISYVRNMNPSKDTRTKAVEFLTTRGMDNVVSDYPIGYPMAQTWDYGTLASHDYLLSFRFERYLRGAN
jgi:4-amino-4-deoxy-L-arabinose transferase-like glycosyltransferase